MLTYSLQKIFSLLEPEERLRMAGNYIETLSRAYKATINDGAAAKMLEQKKANARHQRKKRVRDGLYLTML